MPKRFADLVDRLPKEQRGRAAARRDEILREISLKQLRRALRLTQVELAGTLRVNQAAISKMESQPRGHGGPAQDHRGVPRRPDRHQPVSSEGPGQGSRVTPGPGPIDAERFPMFVFDH